jgi:ABC-type phosphate/phosphonate transport system substrate-binding protein
LNGNQHERDPNEIRLVTYLSPSIPRDFFEALADHLRTSLGDKRVTLYIERNVSGPRRGHECSTFGDRVDVAFLCAPSFAWLRELHPPPAELLGVAPVFDDERNGGRPVYFCDVIVRNEAPIHAFSDLLGGRWAYNDESSLSGYYGLLHKLAESGRDESFFDSVACSGSHIDSIEAVLGDEADAASIDSNVLRIRMRETPALGHRLRVIESWGPYPIQPVVVNSNLDRDLKDQLRRAFLTTNENERTRRILKRFGLSHFTTVNGESYNLTAHQNLATLLTNPARHHKNSAESEAKPKRADKRRR